MIQSLPHIQQKSCKRSRSSRVATKWKNSVLTLTVTYCNLNFPKKYHTCRDQRWATSGCFSSAAIVTHFEITFGPSDLSTSWSRGWKLLFDLTHPHTYNHKLVFFSGMWGAQTCKRRTSLSTQDYHSIKFHLSRHSGSGGSVTAFCLLCCVVMCLLSLALSANVFPHSLQSNVESVSNSWAAAHLPRRSFALTPESSLICWSSLREAVKKFFLGIRGGAVFLNFIWDFGGHFFFGQNSRFYS